MAENEFTYQVVWSEEQQEFVGLCAEFPSLSWLDPSDVQAFRGIRKVVEDVVADMLTNNERVPTPLHKAGPLQTEADYEAALAEISRLWETEPGSADASKLDVLAILVEAYEQMHYPVDSTIQATHYIALLRKDADSEYGIDFPDFPGCITSGATVREAAQNAADALAFHVSGMRAAGESIPMPTSLDKLMRDPHNTGAVPLPVPLASVPKFA